MLIAGGGASTWGTPNALAGAGKGDGVTELGWGADCGGTNGGIFEAELAESKTDTRRA